MSSSNTKGYQDVLIQLEDYVVKIAELKTTQEVNIKKDQSALLKLEQSSTFFWNRAKKERKTQELKDKISHTQDNIVLIDSIMDNMAEYDFEKYDISAIEQFITRLRDLCLLDKMNDSRQHLKA